MTLSICVGFGNFTNVNRKGKLEMRIQAYNKMRNKFKKLFLLCITANIYFVATQIFIATSSTYTKILFALIFSLVVLLNNLHNLPFLATQRVCLSYLFVVYRTGFKLRIQRMILNKCTL